MKKGLLVLIVFGFIQYTLRAQHTDSTSFFSGCAANQLFLGNTELVNKQYALDLAAYNHFQNSNSNKPAGITTIVSIPVVVHIIHNGGTENISNTQVQAAISNINAKYAQSNNYHIQFCLAQRDPVGNATSGITRDSSLLTTEIMELEDISLKDINRWNPNCYLNIWIVKDINSISMGNGVIGYASFPSSHGQNMDGLVIEAAYFGTGADNDGVGAHEIGHYLGLYHTFQNACTNNNCLLDGDQVCDTPPDQTTFSSCFPYVNSCNTDANDPSPNNPYTVDVPDLSDDYMDYSNLNCYTQFTAGQYARMQYFLTNVRSSLLNCLSCTTPCPNPLTAQIITPATTQTITVGASLNFSGMATNTSSYQWYLNSSTILSTGLSGSTIFNTPGTYWLKFTSLSSNPQLCLNGIDSVKIIVIQPAALACEGSLLFSGVSDIVDLPANNQYYSTNGFTWECWFKLNQPLNMIDTRPLINAVDGAVYEDIYLGFGWNLGMGNYPMNHIGLKVDGPNATTGPSNISCSYAPPGGFIVGTWYHVAATMDYINHTAKLYLNGVLADTKTVNSDPFTRVIVSSLGLGWGISNPLYGNLDEVRIWSRVRTAAEIAANYNKCVTGNETNLVLYYPCNQSAGSLAVDATPSGNDGVLVNSTSWSVQQPVLTGSLCVNCNGTCNEKVSAAKDTVICPGSSVGLQASAEFDGYQWSPGKSLSDSLNPNPVASPSLSTNYIVTATKNDINLVVNGNFSSGNTGFTTNYTYCNSNNCLNPLVSDGYSIGTNPNFYHFAFQGSDHTTGTGNMMIVNGSNPAYDVWSQTVNVSSWENYSFSAWACSVYSVNIAKLGFYINNVNIGTLNANPAVNNWDKFNYIWNSGTSTSVTLSIRSLINTPGYSQNGNDFGLDDISFNKVCISSDTVKIIVRNKTMPALNLGSDTSLCDNGVLLMDAGPGYLHYQWHDGSVTQTNTLYGAGKYWVTVTDSCGNQQADTILVKSSPPPLLDLGDNQVVCYNDSLVLSFSPADIFNTYHWSPANGLSCIDCANPHARPPVTTTYYLTATTVRGCSVYDSILVETGSSMVPLVNVRGANTFCGAANGALQITVTPNAPYQYNLNNTGFTTAGNYNELAGGTYTIQIKDANNCIYDTTAIIGNTIADETLLIPNCFTPNNDGANDTWYIAGNCAESISFSIFNRWGQEVKAITGSSGKWDGTFGDSPVPDGVYYYVAEITYYSGNRVKKQGFISVFR
jgi:gliding motility-associated-like protein